MKFMLEFRVRREEKENLFRKLQDIGSTAKGVKINGPWVAVKSGVSFALVESDSAPELWKFCSELADHGEIAIEPVVEMKEILDLG
jgi:hypothetical protein